MKNYHLVLLGKTGYGKTSLARILAGVCPRLLVFDLDNDAIWDSIKYTTDDATKAAEFFARNRSGNFQATLRFQNPETYYTYLQGIYHYQEAEDLPPLCIIIEESGLFSSSYDIKQELEDVIARGRRKKISVVSIAQEDTQINPTVRRQSATMVFVRTTNFSANLRQELTPEEQSQIKRLKALDPYTRPEYGTHYLTVPARENPVVRLAQAMLFTGDPTLPDDYEPPI